MNDRVPAQAAFCHACGTEAATSAAFCHVCGTKLAAIAVVAPAVELSPNSQDPATGDPNSESARSPQITAVDGTGTADDEIDDGDLPRSEWLEFDTPILSAPRAGSPVIRPGVAGDRVPLTGFEDGYAVLGPGGRKGYVVREAVGGRRKFPAGLPTSKIQEMPTTARVRFEAFVLDQPRIGSQVIRRARPGEELRVTRLEGGFACVEAGLNGGFIRADALGFDVPAPSRVVPRTQERRSYSRIGGTAAPSNVLSHVSPAERSSQGQLGRLLFLAGGIGMIASPFLPWVSGTFIFSVNVSLYDAAKMTGEYSGFSEVLILGLLTAAGGLLRNLRLLNLAWARVWGAVSGVVGVIEVIYRYNKFHDELGIVSLQIGFYLLAAASAVMLVGIVIDSDE